MHRRSGLSRSGLNAIYLSISPTSQQIVVFSYNALPFIHSLIIHNVITIPRTAVFGSATSFLKKIYFLLSAKYNLHCKFDVLINFYANLHVFLIKQLRLNFHVLRVFKLTPLSMLNVSHNFSKSCCIRIVGPRCEKSCANISSKTGSNIPWVNWNALFRGLLCAIQVFEMFVNCRQARFLSGSQQYIW